MPTKPATFKPHRLAIKPKENRESAAKRGYGHVWRKVRLTFLLDNPLCAECEKSGRVELATEVDHVTPHKGDMHSFWNGELQGLCKRHHSEKTMRENRA